MTTKEECECVEAAIKTASLASTIEARGLEFRSRSKLGEKNFALIDEANTLKNFSNTFQNTCDMRKLGNRLSQYNLGKEQLEKYIDNPKDIDSAIEAGTNIGTAIRSSIVGKGDVGLIQCEKKPRPF